MCTYTCVCTRVCVWGERRILLHLLTFEPSRRTLDRLVDRYGRLREPGEDDVGCTWTSVPTNFSRPESRFGLDRHWIHLHVGPSFTQGRSWSSSSQGSLPVGRRRSQFVSSLDYELVRFLILIFGSPLYVPWFIPTLPSRDSLTGSGFPPFHNPLCSLRSPDFTRCTIGTFYSLLVEDH